MRTAPPRRFNSAEGKAALDFVVTLIQEGFADESEAVTNPERARAWR